MADAQPQAHSTTPPGVWRRALPWLILLTLTAYAAFARFFWIDRPTLWIDEYATFYRTAGSFEHMMERLERDGFVPLHYLVYWWLAQQVTMTPFWLRLIPAAAGTLFVPALFLLARQLFNRKVAMLAAALAAASAWGMTYSRDAKMYMHTWLLATLGVALLLMWLRQRGPKQWLWLPAWIVCGAASVWLHATALIVIALYPLCLLIRLPSVRWHQPLLLVVGLAAILGGPWWYYTQYNRFIARSGIVAVETHAEEEDRTRWGHSGLHWVANHNRGQSPAQLTLNSASSFLLGIQWPREGHQDPPPGHIQPSAWFKLAASVAVSVVIGLLVIGALPWPRRWRMPTGHAFDPPPGDEADVMQRGSGWRAVLLLAIWIAGPTYGFYCRSFEGFEPPWHWLADAAALLGGYWFYTLGGAVVVGALGVAWRGTAAVAAVLVGGLAATAIAIGIAEGGARWLPEAWAWLDRPWLLGPAVALALGAAWHASGTTPRRRLQALGWIALFVAAMLIVLSGAYFVMDELYQRALDKDTDQPWASIWMPRYLGVIFPAVTIAAAGLLARVPTLPLRTAAIVTLIGLNLTQGWARILADTQPPYDRLAADLIAGRAEDSDTRTVLNVPGNGGLRGRWFDGGDVAYYLAVQTDAEHGERGPDRRELLRTYWARHNLAPSDLAAAVDQSPQVMRIVVWEAFDHQTHADALDGRDPYLDALGPGWRLVKRQRIAERQFWNWRWLGWYRRSVYEKAAVESGE